MFWEPHVNVVVEYATEKPRFWASERIKDARSNFLNYFLRMIWLLETSHGHFIRYSQSHGSRLMHVDVTIGNWENAALSMAQKSKQGVTNEVAAEFVCSSKLGPIYWVNRLAEKKGISAAEVVIGSVWGCFNGEFLTLKTRLWFRVFILRAWLVTWKRVSSVKSQNRPSSGCRDCKVFTCHNLFPFLCRDVTF